MQGAGSYLVMHMLNDYQVKAGFVTSPEHVQVRSLCNMATTM